MNKLSKRVLSLLLALLMVLGTCDQALAAGLDNGRYENDNVIELPENPEPTEKPDEPDPTKLPENPEPTELPENPEPTELPENPEPTELPENPEPTELPENPEPTEKPVVEVKEAVDVAYSDKSEGEYTVAVAEGSYSSDEDAPELKSVSVTPVEGRTVLEGWTISGNGKDLKLTVSIKTMPTLEEGETLALVALNGSVQSSQLKVVTGKDDFASVTVSDSTTGIGLVKIAASAAEETPAEKPIETKEQTLPAGNVSINGVLPVGGSVTAVKQGAAKPQMTFKSVNRAASTQSTTSAPAANEKVLASYDITILDENGESWQPEKPVTVTITDDSFGDGKTLQIYHQGSSGREFVKTVTSHNNTVSFPAEHFSVYVVVESGEDARVKVNFHQNGGNVVSIYVKSEDYTDTDNQKIGTVLYDPGVGDTGSLAFYGWTADENYTTESTMLTIDKIRTEVKAKLDAGVADGYEMNYYAALFKAIVITYHDEKGTVLFSDTKLVKPDVESVAYTADYDYAVGSTDQDFQGWFVSPAANAKLKDGSAVDEEATYPNKTEFLLSDSINLSVDAPTGQWLIFRGNGSGASYTAPQFLDGKNVTKTERPEDPFRRGFTFIDWYTGTERTVTDEEGNETVVVDLDDTPFTFETGLEKTTVVYAKWTEAALADYTVIIWKENIAGDGYDFAESITIPNGNVGRTIAQENKVTITGNGDNAYATVNGTRKQYTGFHLNTTTKPIDRTVTINSNGTTVVNIYYDRTEYTLTFRVGGRTVRTVKAKYESSISQYFPVTGEDGTDYGSYVWDPSGSTVYTKILVTMDYMTAENITLDGDSFYSPNFALMFFVQPESLSTNHADYVQFGKTAYASYNFVTYNEDFIELSGFSRENSDPAFSSYDANGRIYPNGTRQYVDYIGSGDAYGKNGNNYFIVYLNPDDGVFYRNRTWHGGIFGYYTYSNPYDGKVYSYLNITVVKMYYTRDSYTLSYWDGMYVDGDGKEIKDVTKHSGTWSTASVAYGAKLTDYAKGKTKYYEPTAPTGYTFEGWYLDDKCTTPAVFDDISMTKDGVNVYAKWVKTQYRVFLHPNTQDSSLNMGDQNTSFRMSYGETLKFINAARDNYELVGWYQNYDAANNKYSNAFSFDSFEFNDSTVTKPYDRTEPTEYNAPYDTYTSTENNDATKNRIWINHKLELYARWRFKIVGAEGINLRYDSNGGGTAPVDDLLYKDEAQATVGRAVTAPEGKVFYCWVVQKWNGSAFEDTDQKVYPGATFDVLLKNAQKVENEGSTEEEPSFTYTVQLRAEFIDAEQATNTFINWYSNYGSENEGKGALLHEDKDLAINQAVNILTAPTRDGYTFKGWTKTKGGTTADFLVWTGSAYKDAAGNVATQVAADEKLPYDDLFAVWEENNVTINYAVASDSTGKGTVDPTTETIKAATGTAAGSTATASSSTYIIDYWTCDDGTVHVGDEATFVPSKNANDVYEAHTYYAHFKLNQAPVTVHHYLKGTTTKVANDVTEDKTIGTEYTANAATTFLEAFSAYSLKVSGDATQTVTVSVNGNEITFYYVIELTIKAADKSAVYDGSTTLTGEFTISGELTDDSAKILTALGTPPTIGPDVATEEYTAVTTGVPSYYTISESSDLTGKL